MSGNILVFGPDPDPRVIEQMENCQRIEPGCNAVLCADNHLGYSMPIGGVIAYKNHISPTAVGYDIGCGNLAVRTDRLVDKEFDRKAAMDLIWKNISFGMGRVNDEKIVREGNCIFDEISASRHTYAKSLLDLAVSQLGTVGGGNHYVDLFKDEYDFLWIGVHFGSRGFGHKIATWTLEQMGHKEGDMMSMPAVLELSTDQADDYIRAMSLALHYACVGRDWVVKKVCKLLGTSQTFTIHNNHNAAWYEDTPQGYWAWVHRKGASPSNPGVRSFVGGTMFDDAVILEGINSELNERAFYSTIHGAGRVMSRTQAAGKTKRTKSWECGNRTCARFGTGWPISDYNRGPGGSLPLCPECKSKLHPFTRQAIIKPGIVDFTSVKARMEAANIELRGAGADEAPECYKKLPEVLEYHKDTVKILYTLTPIGVAMAGSDIEDPYKD